MFSLVSLFSVCFIFTLIFISVVGWQKPMMFWIQTRVLSHETDDYSLFMGTVVL